MRIVKNVVDKREGFMVYFNYRKFFPSDINEIK
ncbi:MAG: hypothetical protein UW09_C0001G0023 [candidate division TM6 bacterium GW2011_GWF2_43_87]|nr:MAG: hypothetical protein UW09_C0001G0023 [candidate division TM6 bacterium GW2011_GWF2_43_87]